MLHGQPTKKHSALPHSFIARIVSACLRMDIVSFLRLPQLTCLPICFVSHLQLCLRAEVRYPFAAWLAHQAGLSIATTSSSSLPSGSGGFSSVGSTSGTFGYLPGFKSWEGLKRWEICQVSRQGLGVSLPSSYLQADFDVLGVVGSSSREKMLAEAEVIKMTTQVSLRTSVIPCCKCLRVCRRSTTGITCRLSTRFCR